MKKYLKIYLCILLIMAVGFITAGCNGKVYFTTGFNNDEMIKVSGEVVPMSLGRLILAVEKSNYASELGDEIWKLEIDGESLWEKLKQTVKIQLSELKTISMLAKEKNILLSVSENEKINNATEEFYNSLSEEEREALGITKEDVRTLYEYFRVSEKLYELTTNGITVEISDEEARVIKVQYCFVKKYYYDENNNEKQLDSEGVEAARKIIEEANEKIKTGTDFSLIAKEYSDDTIYEYEFGRGEMEQNFENAAFSLENGEISDIVESEKGFYIIKCLNSYEELKTEENKVELLKKYKNKAFHDMYEPFMAEQTYEYNDKEYNNIDIDSLVLNNNKLYEIYSQYLEE